MRDKERWLPLGIGENFPLLFHARKFFGSLKVTPFPTLFPTRAGGNAPVYTPETKLGVLTGRGQADRGVCSEAGGSDGAPGSAGDASHNSHEQAESRDQGGKRRSKEEVQKRNKEVRSRRMWVSLHYPCSLKHAKLLCFADGGSCILGEHVSLLEHPDLSIPILVLQAQQRFRDRQKVSCFALTLFAYQDVYCVSIVLRICDSAEQTPAWEARTNESYMCALSWEWH